MIDVTKLFTPKQAIRNDNREFFAGRRELLTHALDEIAVPGASMVVFGDRGVGKTSFAWQLREILDGKHERLRQLALQPQLPVANCCSVWVSCHQGMRSLEGVLLAFLTPNAEEPTLPGLFPKAFRPEELDRIERAYSFNVGIAKADFKVAAEERKEPARIDDVASFLEDRQKIHYYFGQKLREVRRAYPQKQLILFVDEMDNLESRAGFGRLIKEISSARFVLVGVGDTILEVVEDHESAARKLEGSKIRVPTLDHVEIETIIDRAEGVYPGKVRFTEGFRRRIIEGSDGYPWLVQLLCFHATRNALKRQAEGQPVEVNETDYEQGIDIVAGPHGDEERSERLRRALGDSNNKRKVISVIAQARPEGLSEQQVQRALETTSERYFFRYLEPLEAGKILRRTEDGRIKFRDPVMRKIVQFLIAGDRL